MREAISEIVTFYREYTGVSIIVPMVFISIFVINLINNYIYINDDKRRRINPTVFLLSIWIMISYALTVVLRWFTESEDKNDSSTLNGFKKISCYLFSLLICVMSGRFVFYKSYLEMSSYADSNIVKNILSVCIIVACIIINIIIANALFDDKRDKITFIIYFIVLNIFSVYSDKAVCVNLFLNPTGIGSILFNLILPAILLIIIWKFKDEISINSKAAECDKEDIENSDEEYEEEWDMKKHKILNMRNMAIAFIVLIVTFAGVVFILNSKINNLYNATLMLEQAARDKASVLTYTSEENENISIQVIVSGDGLIQVYGGGKYEDGVQFMEYLKQYGTTVDKWYLNSNDDTGVYEYCKNNGIVVNSLYSVTGIEKVD